MKEKGKTLSKRTPGGTAFKHARAYRGVYLMATPVLVAALIFYYLPMFGIRYAFFTYKGINDPIFVGMKHFVKMFSMPGFWKAFSNTLVLSITKLILNTGAAVIISVLLNELIFLKLKKVFQTIVYIPHFMSWVVAASIFSMIMSPTSAGLVNDVMMKLHLITDNIYFLGDQKWWRFSYYIINVWKDTDFQIGIGKSVEGYQRLKESYHEASQAIKYIEIIRQVTGDKNKSVVHYSNLGFFQIFSEIDDVTELERYIPETLKKLYLYDDEHKGELITTLQMYLRNNQSIKKTAGAMFVHYRTISYRLEKIKQISGINFDNANEVLAVSNGLIIYKMLKEIE